MPTLPLFPVLLKGSSAGRFVDLALKYSRGTCELHLMLPVGSVGRVVLVRVRILLLAVPTRLAASDAC